MSQAFLAGRRVSSLMAHTSPCVISIMGPTASGKTRLALELVQRLPCRIISVDSAMVYRGMDIGTAKPTLAEQAAAPHRLIDIRDPAQAYSAGQFCTDALNEIADIVKSGHIPLLVGGTMLYHRALQYGLSALPSADPKIRQALSTEAEHLGWPALHQRLKELDPLAAARIHCNDGQRIQRALEIHAMTGTPFSTYCQQQPRMSPAFRWLNIALWPVDREQLHQRIMRRFEQMLTQGLLEEVQALRARPDLHVDLPALRAVGYRQVWEYLENKSNREEMMQRATAKTRQLAKQQLTWLRAWPQKHDVDSEDPFLTARVLQLIREFLI